MTTQTFNLDIASAYELVNRFVTEIIHSQSSGLTNVTADDKTRWNSYVAALRTQLNLTGEGVPKEGKPPLDTPETHPQVIDLEDAPDVPEISNHMAKHLARLFGRIRDNLVRSQSSRMSSGGIFHDLKRYVDGLAAIDTYLKTHVEPSSPLDLPETAPAAMSTGPGQTGLEPAGS